MNSLRSSLALVAISLALGAAGASRLPLGLVASRLPLELVATIPLAGVEGRIDHLAFDADAQRLYVAALGNDSVEVLDVAAGRLLRSVKGFREPQGVAVIPQPPQVAVANGEGSGVELRAGDDLHLVRSVPLGEDSDNVRVDAAAGRIYVGYGRGAIAAIDVRDGRKVGEVALDGHPESFQLEASGPRLFVNVPSAHRVVVVDRAQLRQLASWPVTAARDNFPMALDQARHRLFVGCRTPAVVLVFDTLTGRQTASAAISGDTDDLFWDDKRQRLYVSAGEGAVDVLQDGNDGLRRTARIPSAAGARTSLFVPALGRLYLAVPHRGSQRAEVRVYETRE